MPSFTLESAPEWARGLLERSRVGHLGLLDSDRHPRVLPVSFALHDGAVWTAIDRKPKRSPPARVRWLHAAPRAAITVDHYEDDWSRLAWVQLIGEIAVLDGPPSEPVLAALCSRYDQYRREPPPGPVLRLEVSRAVCWRAADS